MAKKKSLHIGLNALDPESYGDPNELIAAEADAEDMSRIATGQGFDTTVLLTNQATIEAVLAGIAAASDELGPGDLFFLTYSGHGGQVPDVDGDEEDDEFDETWCLFDSQLRDDDINGALSRFAKGVGVLMLSDSCHSGTVHKGLVLKRDASLREPSRARARRLPLAATVREFNQHKSLYRSRVTAKQSAVKATGALVSGCRDDQKSLDGEENGAFTAAFLSCWGDGAFQGDLNNLYEAIKETLEKDGFDQDPELNSIARDDDDFHVFLAERPLTA